MRYMQFNEIDKSLTGLSLHIKSSKTYLHENNLSPRCPVKSLGTVFYFTPRKKCIAVYNRVFETAVRRRNVFKTKSVGLIRKKMEIYNNNNLINIYLSKIKDSETLTNDLPYHHVSDGQSFSSKNKY